MPGDEVELSAPVQHALVAKHGLVRVGGQARLVAFYRAVAGPGPQAGSAPGAAARSEPPTPAAAADRAFGSVLGTTEQAFVSSWASYAARLAGA